MSSFIWPSIGFFALFSVFVHFLQWHADDFRGASRALHVLIAVSASAGFLTGVVYLGYYAWTVSWWAAPLVFILGLAGVLIGISIARVTGPYMLSLGGLVGLPVSAYYMFTTLPASA